jgi:phytoene dehydrogenase-like protein
MTIYELPSTLVQCSRQEEQVMADYDAIVIGAGNNALVCALYLARAGWRVLVLEQASDVGGAARSAEVTCPGFKHDLFATNFTSFTESPAYRDFKSELDTLDVRFLNNSFPYASAYSGGKVARIYCDPEMSEHEIARFSPRDLAGWRAAVSFFKRTAPTFLPLHTTTLPSVAMFRRLARIATGRPADTLALCRLLLESPRQFVDHHFHSPEVKGLFTPWAFHLDYGPDVRGGATFSFVSAISAYLHGIKVVRGGASCLFTTVRALIEKYGGEVLVNSKVAGIEISDNRAVGVRLERGDVITAGKAVIANVAPRWLFGTLVASDTLPSGFYRRISRFRHGVGTFVVHLALSQELQWNAADDLSGFNYVHLYGSTEEIDNTYTQALAGYLPSRPMLVVSQTTQVDPSRAPSGKHVARIHARAFPMEIRDDAAGTIRGREWDAIKESMADRLVEMLAEHAPNVHSALLARHCVSPLDLQRSNPNLINGDCNGGSHHLDQYYFARPVPGWTRYSTPIRSLHMIGASQWPGSGVNGSSGYLLAQQLLA